MMSFWVVPWSTLRSIPFSSRGDDVERQQPRRRRVDRHRRVHLVERDPVEQRVHVALVRHRHPDLADLAARELVVGVVARLRRQVERDAQPGLALGQVAPVQLVGLARGRMARVGAHHPGPVGLLQAVAHASEVWPRGRNPGDGAAEDPRRWTHVRRHAGIGCAMAASAAPVPPGTAAAPATSAAAASPAGARRSPSPPSCSGLVGGQALSLGPCSPSAATSRACCDGLGLLLADAVPDRRDRAASRARARGCRPARSGSGDALLAGGRLVVRVLRRHVALMGCGPCWSAAVARRASRRRRRDAARRRRS